MVGGAVWFRRLGMWSISATWTIGIVSSEVSMMTLTIAWTMMGTKEG